MKARKNRDSFWLSYSDLMTSLFFIMLVLFVACAVKLGGLAKLPEDIKGLKATIIKLKKENERLVSENETLKLKASKQGNIIADLKDKINRFEVKEDQYKKIHEIQGMFQSLSEGKTLEYRSKQRTFVAKAFEDKEIFKPNTCEFNFKNISGTDIIQVGKDLEEILKGLYKKNPDCSYQLVIEGTTANSYKSHIPKDSPISYKLSYERALALYNLWLNSGINLRKYNTEILICGSGMNGINRDKAKEDNNKRIIIQIIPKFNKI